MTVPIAPSAVARLDLLGLAPFVCEPDGLRREDARTLARRLIAGIPFARLIDCRRGSAGDLVIMEVEVETPQRTAHDIRLVERIGAWFVAPQADEGELPPPETFALREDFPRDVSHVNLREYEYPRSLCLFDVAFDELRAAWTPGRFVTLVREWLRLTSRGELHAADQPLEPLMLGGAGWIILPNILRKENAALGLERRGQIGGLQVLVAVPPDQVQQGERRFVVACVRTTPRTHGAIRRAPGTLANLHELLTPEDDLRAQLAAVLREWKQEGIGLDAQVAIVVMVPLRRDDSVEPEIEQPWAFLTVESIADVGKSLGLWEATPHGLGTILGPGGGDGGSSISVLPLYAYFQHRREDGARFNGRRDVDDRPFVAIGAGALGSQVLGFVARTAFGRWTVVDGDVFLPHNVARHALGNSAVGFAKAIGVASGVMRDAAADGDLHRSIVTNMLAPGEQRATLEQAYANAVSIVDMSASVAVARALARDVTAPPRRISLFLNPMGTDLVLLAESTNRAVRLDALEMQYYRAISHEPALAGTLRGAVNRQRYGRSCRDVSSQLPHARVTALAALGAQALERVVDETGAVIRVWRLNESSLGVQSVEVAVHPVFDVSVGDWRIVTDEGLLARLRELRIAKLPSETGGVLLGAVDVARRVVYVVDTIPSPPDSQEWPTLYIRGAAGLIAEVERVREATAGQLHYIGEWHSHPEGCAPLPSADDMKVFVWITEALDADDLPAVMMIVGDSGISTFVASMPVGRQPTILRPDGAIIDLG
ncbi:MAG: Mov34/MPN/PAD-1 family protein [Gemmatimonadota bacterium]